MTTPGDDYWFTPKRHGYGAAPKNWKGWMATMAFAIGLPLVSLPWLLSLEGEWKLPGMIIWALAMLGAVWKFTDFAKRKTDGPWMWRWHGKPYRQMYDEAVAQAEERQREKTKPDQPA